MPISNAVEGSGALFDTSALGDRTVPSNLSPDLSSVWFHDDTSYPATLEVVTEL